MAKEERAPLLQPLLRNGVEEGSSSPKVLPVLSHSHGDGSIVSIFVAKFDVHAGNEIEWSYPKDAAVDLKGVEFKAVPAGAHTVDHDFIFFRQAAHYGLAYYNKRNLGPTASGSSAQRGAVYRSVGVLLRGFSQLNIHTPFLRAEVGMQAASAAAGNPPDYTRLVQYFDNQRVVPTTPPGMEQGQIADSSEAIPHFTEDWPSTAPQLSSLVDFVKYFGVNVFVIWKAMLLGRRVLFYAPPPAGLSSCSVYCACALPQHTLRAVRPAPVNPLFYINLNDITQLTGLKSYTACTTEKIFSSKPKLFDIFFDERQFTVPNEAMAEVLQITKSDEQRYKRLEERLTSSGRNDATVREFFVEVNDRILNHLTTMGSNNVTEISRDDFTVMGMSSVDASFLISLGAINDARLIYTGSGVCPCC